MSVPFPWEVTVFFSTPMTSFIVQDPHLFEVLEAHLDLDGRVGSEHLHSEDSTRCYVQSSPQVRRT